MSNKVTKVTEQDERYVSRSGVLQVNPYEVARRIEAARTPAQIEEQARGRMSVEGMEMALRQMREKESECAAIVSSLTPEVAKRQGQVANLREQWEHAEECSKAGMMGARVDAFHLAKKLRWAEQDLAAFQVRLERQQRFLDVIKTANLEWLKLNGSLLAKLRKLIYKRI